MQLLPGGIRLRQMSSTEFRQSPIKLSSWATLQVFTSLFTLKTTIIHGHVPLHNLMFEQTESQIVFETLLIFHIRRA